MPERPHFSAISHGLPDGTSLRKRREALLPPAKIAQRLTDVAQGVGFLRAVSDSPDHLQRGLLELESPARHSNGNVRPAERIHGEHLPFAITNDLENRE